MRIDVEDRGWSSTCQILSDRMMERSGDAVHSLHRAQGDEECEVLALASKPRSMISPSLTSKLVATVLVVWPQNYSLGFPGLGLKTGSRGLMIWASKSPRRFLSLSLKTKWEEVC
jgi:hypothetical protein